MAKIYGRIEFSKHMIFFLTKPQTLTFWFEGAWLYLSFGRGCTSSGITSYQLTQNLPIDEVKCTLRAGVRLYKTCDNLEIRFVTVPLGTKCG